MIKRKNKETFNMDAYELISDLNQVPNLGDTIDGTGLAGVYTLTNGENRSL